MVESFAPERRPESGGPVGDDPVERCGEAWIKDEPDPRLMVAGQGQWRDAAGDVGENRVELDLLEADEPVTVVGHDRADGPLRHPRTRRGLPAFLDLVACVVDTDRDRHDKALAIDQALLIDDP